MTWNYWLLVLCVFIASIFLFGHFRKKREEARAKDKAERDRKEKALLDDFEIALKEEFITNGEIFESYKPKIHRKHDYYLKLIEQDIDEKTALQTPTVVIQFNQQTRQIELRLYVRQFYRDNSSSNSLIETNRLDYYEGCITSAAKSAIVMFRSGFIK